MLSLYSRRCSSCTSADDSSLQCVGDPHFLERGFGAEQLMIVRIQRGRAPDPAGSAPGIHSSGSRSSNINPSPRNDSGMGALRLGPVIGVGAQGASARRQHVHIAALGAEAMLHPADGAGIQIRDWRATRNDPLGSCWVAHGGATLAVAAVRRRDGTIASTAPLSAAATSSCDRSSARCSAADAPRGSHIASAPGHRASVTIWSQPLLTLRTRRDHFAHDRGIVVALASVRRASMYTYSERKFCGDLPAALHIERAVQLVDHADGLAHGLALGHDLVQAAGCC